MKIKSCLAVLPLLAVLHSAAYGLTLEKTIEGDLASKSIVYSGTGLFFAQNMMYRHTISVYNRDYELVKVISDQVRLSSFGFPQQGLYRGAPVEAAFSHGGKYAWVSNYNMHGDGYQRPGNDDCTPDDKADKSFVYKIDTGTLQIADVVPVGSVPKFIAATPDNRRVIVSNWCSWDVNVIDTATDKVIRTVLVGRYPRGLAVTSDSRKVYIAVMGSYDIAVLDLTTFKISWLKGVGRSPRHLVLSKDDKYLYATLNAENLVAKISTETGQVVSKIATGDRPRSMVASGDGKYLYVVNYESDTVSKVDADSMAVLETVPVNHHPIGITCDPETGKVWVACYSGTLMVFEDGAGAGKPQEPAVEAGVQKPQEPAAGTVNPAARNASAPANAGKPLLSPGSDQPH